MKTLRAALAAVLLVGGAPQAAEPVDVVVFAASSLREAFTEIAAGFEREHSGARVVLNFAGSQDLVAQIENGAIADVLACADEATLAKLAAARLVAEPRIFARNAPVLVTALSPPEPIRDFADLPRARRIVLGAREVPIGRYSREILDRASERYGRDFRSRVEAHVVSHELNVRQVLAKVTLGEADAAIVYRTDAATVGEKVRTIAIPEEINVIAAYPIAVVASSARRPIAEKWIDAVLGPAGQAVLVRRGFLPTHVAGRTAR